MKRDYDSGVTTEAVIFKGSEVEQTCFKNHDTIFVVGDQPIAVVIDHVYNENCSHIYLGANHSATRDLIPTLIEQVATYITGWNKCVTLDIDIGLFEFASGLIIGNGIQNSNQFCLIVSCKLPGVELIKNTYVKVDDLDFKYSNSGVWLHPATEYAGYTSWSKYTQDKILQTAIDTNSK